MYSLPFLILVSLLSFTLMIIMIVVVLFLAASVRSLFTDVPFVPTPERTIREMLTLAKLKPGETLVDLGSGDGRIVVIGAKNYAAHAIGVEKNFLLAFFSRLHIAMKGVSRSARIIRNDIFSIPLSQADVVTLYLLPAVNKKLEHKLKTELRKGSRVVSRSFPLPHWKPDIIDERNHIYLYRIPPRTL